MCSAPASIFTSPAGRSTRSTDIASHRDRDRVSGGIAPSGLTRDKGHDVKPLGTQVAMPAFLCETCGSQFTPSDEPPPECPICQDERQFVPPGGQKWTTLDALARRHFNSYRQHEPGVIGIGTEPKFSIGQ